MSTIDKAEEVNLSHETDAILTHKEAKAASPDDISVGGEEDPGVGLEDLVEKHINPNVG